VYRSWLSAACRARWSLVPCDQQPPHDDCCGEPAHDFIIIYGDRPDAIFNLPHLTIVLGHIPTLFWGIAPEAAIPGLEDY
jgi:hypothetical protein